MGFADATRELGGIAQLQWGLVSTRQAAGVGVSRLQLSRMAQSGVIERLAYGIYRLAGVPAAEHEEIYVAWLGLNHATGESGAAQPEVVVAGAAAARLHGIGDIWLDQIDFITLNRHYSRRLDVRIRTRELSLDETTTVEGVPVLTAARTLADIVEVWTDLSLVADMARDALARGILNLGQLGGHLEPLAAANGFQSGAALRDHILKLAGHLA